MLRLDIDDQSEMFVNVMYRRGSSVSAFYLELELDGAGNLFEEFIKKTNITLVVVR